MYLNVRIVKRYLFNTFRLRKQPGVKSTKDSCVVFENPIVIQSMEETSPQGYFFLHIKFTVNDSSSF